MPASDDYSEGRVPGPASAEATADALVLEAVHGVGERLDRFLASRLDGVSRSRIQQWIALGAVWCDERPLAAKSRLSGFERIHVQPLPREADHAFEPDPVALRVVDQDDALIVIDKPAGLVVHPAAGHWRGTLLNGLLHAWPAQAMLARAGIVHRLDKDTTGLMVVGRTESACLALSAQLADRSMSRRYLAFVRGDPPSQGTVSAPMGRDPRLRTRMAVVDGASGKPAVTHFRTLATGRLQGRALALVECRLETGRTHQIRVHMAHVGHPLQGDGLYGGAVEGIARQALHAWSLELLHPLTRERRRWRLAPPDDLHALADAAGIDLPAHYRQLDARPN